MKKGFTLIELLAVIVILAIIATIATPIVLNIIKDAKKSSNIRSAENYIHSLELSLANNQLTSSNLSDGFYSIDEIEVNVDGKKPTQGYVQIEKGNVVKYNVMINNQEVDSIKDYKIWKNINDKKAVESVNGVYHIILPSELAWVAQVVNEGTNSFEGETISIDANLDLNNIEWIPIGTSDNPFAGSFEGNNHIIKNLYINLPEEKLQGLFGYTIDNSNAYLKDLVMIDSHVISNGYSAIFLAMARKSVVVENILVYNSNNESTDIVVGSIVGQASKGAIIKNNVSYNNNIKCESYCGGITGVLRGESTNLKSINNKIIGDESIGGITSSLSGYEIYSSSNLISKNNEIHGSAWVGGICGYIDGTIATNLISENNVIFGNSIVGGITGTLQNNTVLHNSISTSNLYTKALSEVSKIGGICGAIQNSTINDATSSGIIDMSIATEVGGICGVIGNSLNTPTTIEKVNSTIKINASNNIGTIIGQILYNVKLDDSKIKLNINGTDTENLFGSIADPTYITYE